MKAVPASVLDTTAIKKKFDFDRSKAHKLTFRSICGKACFLTQEYTPYPIKSKNLNLKLYHVIKYFDTSLLILLAVVRL